MDNSLNFSASNLEQCLKVYVGEGVSIRINFFSLYYAVTSFHTHNLHNKT